jgi:glycosyltransferase involved in cell wall biosynthesis
MRLAGLMLVRDEADVLAVNLRHHLGVVDDLFVVDNGSSDETPAILRRFARRYPQVRWTTETGEYLQSKILTTLAQDARMEGADWVVSIDADEFWRGRHRPVKEVIAAAGSTTGALQVPVVNYVQGRWFDKAHRRTLLTMTRRSPTTMGSPQEAAWLVANHHASYVEATYAPKLICRTSRKLTIGIGNHLAEHLDGPVVGTEEIVCLHAPLRSRETLLRKAATADRVENDDFGEGAAWQPRRWATLDADELAMEWDANSYEGAEDLSLDVYGYDHPLVVDTLLRETVLPYFSLADRMLSSLAWRRHVRTQRRNRSRRTVSVSGRQEAGETCAQAPRPAALDERELLT